MKGLGVAAVVMVLGSGVWGAEYFPLAVGNRWLYQTSTGMGMTVAVTGEAPVRGVRCAAVETTLGWQSSREFMRAEADGLKAYKSEMQGQEFFYDPPVVRVKLPFEQGQTWTSAVNQFGMSIRTAYQSAGRERVQTPAGAFDCIVVQSTAALPGQPPVVSMNYYAPEMGLVYQVVQTGGQQMIATLVSANVQPAQAPAQTAPAASGVSEEATATAAEKPALERYESDDGKVVLYKPAEWRVQQEELGEGMLAVSVLEPEEDAAVVFMSFPVDEAIGDSVQLMARCMAGLREEYPDIEATSVKSSREKDRTIAKLTLTAEGKKGMGHGYFFHTERMGTVYILLAKQDRWEALRPTLTTVAANLAYAPEGVEKIAAQGQALAAEQPAAGGTAQSPAVMLQRAGKRAGRQVPLRRVALGDQSMTLEIPEGWQLQGQKLQFTTFKDAQTKQYGVGSGGHTIIPTQFAVPGTINATYQPPARALQLVLELGQVGTDVRVLSECPTVEALPEASEGIHQMRAMGFEVDARLMHVRFRSMATGATLRGLFAVQCSIKAMSPVWQIAADGSWAPDAEYEEWLPLYLRITKSTKLNEQWFAGEMQSRQMQQQHLNRNLQNSIAESNRAFDGYMDSLRDADRSRDYISHMWSQTTLGQGSWVAENEGAKVYQTDSWGIEGPEGRIDTRAYNNTHFTGENPWGGEDLDLVDTREEYERYIGNP